MNQRRKAQPHGHLFIIGGAEDREEDKLVLARFVELAGGPDARIAVVTAANSCHDEVWPVYDEAFRALGVATWSCSAARATSTSCARPLRARRRSLRST
jgi:cyanophycinase